MNKGLIAIIDDDDLDRYIFKKLILLTCSNYEVTDFSNAVDALAYLERYSNDGSKLPDLLLLDVKMPLINGWEYLQQYQTLKHRLVKSTRHYVCTSSMEHFKCDVKTDDLFGYFMKPLAPDLLRKIIRDSELQTDAGLLNLDLPTKPNH